MDEMNVDVDKFQALLYDHCYQYQRATTPVSLCKYMNCLPSYKANLDSPCGLLCALGLQARRGSH